MPKIDPEKIIADYFAAYQCANKRPSPYTVKYERGWFHIRQGRLPASRYRAAAILDMTDRLRAMAAEKERTK